MKEIKLHKGEITEVSDEDFDHLKKYKWYCHRPNRKKPYVYRYSYRGKGKQLMESMHRVIMGLVHGDKRVVDHINGNTLDNRRENLKITTSQINCRNREKAKDATSKYYGVSMKRKKAVTGDYVLWQAVVRVAGKNILQKAFKSELDAAKCYNEFIKENKLEGSRLNEGI